MISGLSGLRNARAMARVRSTSSFQPNILLMTFMSLNRLVTTRWFGLPLTLWNSTGQPPSMCFCSPVTSRSGSTAFSVSMRSPCARSHSSVERRSRVPRLAGASCRARPRGAPPSWRAFPCAPAVASLASSWGLIWPQYDRSRSRLEGSRKRVSRGGQSEVAHRAFVRWIIVRSDIASAYTHPAAPST